MPRHIVALLLHTVSLPRPRAENPHDQNGAFLDVAANEPSETSELGPAVLDGPRVNVWIPLGLRFSSAST